MPALLPGRPSPCVSGGQLIDLVKQTAATSNGGSTRQNR
jgi:hypothetical protein